MGYCTYGILHTHPTTCAELNENNDDEFATRCMYTHLSIVSRIFMVACTTTLCVLKSLNILIGIYYNLI